MQITTELKWRAAATVDPSVSLREWILHPGSFMQRLEQQGITNSQIRVLQQAWQLPLEDEHKSLQLLPGVETLVREVLIFNESKKWVFARTVFPLAVIEIQPELANLQTRSLGSILFKDPTMRRSEFEVASVYLGSSWYQAIMQHVTLSQPILWARRSMFFLQEQRLLLTEVFLPDIEQI